MIQWLMKLIIKKGCYMNSIDKLADKLKYLIYSFDVPSQWFQKAWSSRFR